MKCFILSTMDYHLFFFSPLPIIYCILLFVCQSLTINLCDARVNNLVSNLKVHGEFQFFSHLSTSFFPTLNCLCSLFIASLSRCYPFDGFCSIQLMSGTIIKPIE